MRTKFAEFRSTINSPENSPKFYNETSAIIPLQTLVNELNFVFSHRRKLDIRVFSSAYASRQFKHKKRLLFSFSRIAHAQPFKFKFFLLRIIYFHFRDAFVNPAHRFKRITTEGQRILTSIFMAHFSDPLNHVELEGRCINKLNRFHYPGNDQRVLASYFFV